MTKAFVLRFLFTFLMIVPKDGAKKGIQYLKIIRSGFISMILFAVPCHVSGLTELRILSASNSVEDSDSMYCDLPGNNILGYCVVKLIAITS